MTVTEKLAGSIDTFCDSPKACRARLLFTTIAWFFHTVLSYGTDSWVELSGGPTESNQGLWNHCSKSLSNTDITCRESVSNFLEYRNQDVPDSIQAISNNQTTNQSRPSHEPVFRGLRVRPRPFRPDVYLFHIPPTEDETQNNNENLSLHPGMM